MRYLQDGIIPDNFEEQKYVMMEKDRLVVLDGLLYYVDSARKDRARLMVPEVLRKELFTVKIGLSI